MRHRRDREHCTLSDRSRAGGTLARQRKEKHHRSRFCHSTGRQRTRTSPLCQEEPSRHEGSCSPRGCPARCMGCGQDCRSKLLAEHGDCAHQDPHAFTCRGFRTCSPKPSTIANTRHGAQADTNTIPHITARTHATLAQTPRTLCPRVALSHNARAQARSYSAYVYPWPSRIWRRSVLLRSRLEAQGYLCI